MKGNDIADYSSLPEDAEQRWSAASGRGTGVNVQHEIVPRPEVTAHLNSKGTNSIDYSPEPLTLGLASA